jgi:predicted dinucleotide-binding enzyme
MAGRHGEAIAIIGAGARGMALAAALTRAGENILFGVRDKARTGEDVKRRASTFADVVVTDIEDAVASSGIVIVAIPYPAVLHVAAAIIWDGRILVDPTNPVLPDHSGLMVSGTVSAAEEIAARASSARVVKAFNCLFPEVLQDADFGEGQPFLPVCGDDRAAVDAVIALARRMALDATYAGPLSSARYIEPFTMLSVALLFAGQPRGFSFARMTR